MYNDFVFFNTHNMINTYENHLINQLTDWQEKKVSYIVRVTDYSKVFLEKHFSTINNAKEFYECKKIDSLIGNRYDIELVEFIDSGHDMIEGEETVLMTTI